ncbi:hypothetical protein KSS87_021410 [Heliosperma pusillum]|nr:hypothetical protein KSS87_021410 [Heliosperma pusillum]
MGRISGILRPLLRRQLEYLRPISSGSTPLMSTFIPPSSSSSSLLYPSYMSFSSLSIPAVACLFSPSSPSSPSRCYSSSSESPSNMVLVKSENQLSESLRKATDDSFPAIFYFTAEWCGPCRFLWPDIKKLSESLPDVTFYKIDIDEVGTGPTVHKFCISSVPTLHFFKDGKKAAEVVGADSRKIKDITASLYKPAVPMSGRATPCPCRAVPWHGDFSISRAVARLPTRRAGPVPARTFARARAVLGRERAGPVPPVVHLARLPTLF